MNNQNIKNMFFFKEVQTVRQRRGAIASLDLVYNSRNASIRHKGNFEGSLEKLQLSKHIEIKGLANDKFFGRGMGRVSSEVVL